jgi:hypothetical protein
MVKAIRKRAGQRGASVLIVFLVLTMLTGIGMYAARSSTLSMSVSGSLKQRAQTRHLTEYAITSALSALSRDPSRYVNQMPKYMPVAGDTKCLGSANVPNATCFPFSYEELNTEATVPLILPADVANEIPGGLGSSKVEADFNIDMTDLQPAAPPVPGEALNDDSSVKVGYLSVTLTATGQLRPKPPNLAGFQQTIASSASVQMWRAHVVVGPMTNPAPRAYVP